MRTTLSLALSLSVFISQAQIEETPSTPCDSAPEVILSAFDSSFKRKRNDLCFYMTNGVQHNIAIIRKGDFAIAMDFDGDGLTDIVVQCADGYYGVRQRRRLGGSAVAYLLISVGAAMAWLFAGEMGGGCQVRLPQDAHDGPVRSFAGRAPSAIGHRYKVRL